MSEPIIVTAGTPDYMDAARRLRDQARAFGHDAEAYCYPDRGNWSANTRGAPECVLRVRESNPSRPILWMDADSIIERAIPFDEIPEVCDVAAPLSNAEQRMFIKCALWLAPTAGATMFLRVWSELCNANSGEKYIDEYWLERARRCVGSFVVFRVLPKEWSWLPRHGTPNERVIVRIGISGKARGRVIPEINEPPIAGKPVEE